MRFLFYTHSLVSDWNHGNAHFLRGVMRALAERGHSVQALEPEGAWSRTNLIADQGADAEARFFRDFPMLRTQTYGSAFEHEAALAEADVVLVHEWTDPALVARIGKARAQGGRFTLLFHDTHHRAVSQEEDIAGLLLADYDGILAFGETLRQRYLKAGWGRSVFTWHEAADTALFRPLPETAKRGDLIWIGNWGDGERTRELQEFLVEPVRSLGIQATVRGVRYPADALARLEAAGLHHGGWIANADVPAAFAAHRVTVHVPRRPYVEALPGIPTIRMFEALACGIPLVSAPWSDAENLFRPGEDFLFAADGEAMARTLREILDDPDRAAALSASGLATIRARHTCAHRVDELFAILGEVGTASLTRQLRHEEAAQ
ncbi:CgeB family protein [Mangrovibrevibacter kandeliae]|uniref:CgeB family protein n=1 Tax=Mangrovibrevibacter kandeliae TaxID=2968473 RepID=UPI002118E9E0|nr:glycosyltransferase [Aurantimonas sp. CSK15Z-1]MCQ8782975.1 glycosyltransferase [Aurantimonas sp. CSK15Z-1]